MPLALPPGTPGPNVNVTPTVFPFSAATNSHPFAAVYGSNVDAHAQQAQSSGQGTQQPPCPVLEDEQTQKQAEGNEIARLQAEMVKLQRKVVRTEMERSIE